jgi:hypothetical protein
MNRKIKFILTISAASLCLSILGQSVGHSIHAATEQARYTLTIHTLGPDTSPLPETELWVVVDRRVFTGKSNDEGIWILENLPSAPITIVALKDTFSLAGNEGYLIQDESIKLQLRKPQELMIQAVTPQNTPIAGAALRELRINDRFSVNYELLKSHGLPSVHSDEEGTIQVPYLPRYGFAGVKISHRKYLDGILPAVPVGETIPLVMLQGGKIRGRVTTPDGQGVSQAQVTLFRVQDTQNITIAEVLTDKDGFYQVSAPLKPSHIAARHTDFAIPNPQVAGLSQTQPEIIIDHQLLPPRSLTGTTVDENGDPVPRVWISYRSDNSTFNEVLTNDQGEYNIVAREGRGQLNVSPPPGLMTVKHHTIGLELDSEDSIHLQPIRLKSLPKITGTLTSENRGPAIPLILHSTNITPPIWTTTDNEGHFSIQLNTMPDTSSVSWIAEHPLRFQRVSFETSLDTQPQEPVDLKSFRPNLEKDSKRSLNDLKHLIAKPAPPWECDAWFNLPDEKESLELQELEGKIIVLLLWGGFGINSKSQLRVEEFNAYFKAYENVDDVVILGIHDASQEPIEVQQTIKDWGITFPIGCDADPFVSFDLYNVNSIPQTVIIDPKGIVSYAECDGRIPELIKAIRRKF